MRAEPRHRWVLLNKEEMTSGPGMDGSKGAPSRELDPKHLLHSPSYDPQVCSSSSQPGTGSPSSPSGIEEPVDSVNRSRTRNQGLKQGNMKRGTHAIMWRQSKSIHSITEFAHHFKWNYVLWDKFLASLW